MINIEVIDEIPFARISGDIDMANVARIEDTIGYHVKSEPIGFVMDLSAVTYLDSAGIRLLYQLDERANGRQQRCIIVVPQGALISRSLEAAGAIGSLKIVATSEEAVDALRA